MVGEVHVEVPNKFREKKDIGLKNFDFDTVDTSTIFADIFLLLSPQKWKLDLAKINKNFEEHNIEASTVRPIEMFSVYEYFVCHALMIAGVCFSEKGENLFRKTYPHSHFVSFASAPNFQNYIKKFRFAEYCCFFPAAMTSQEKQETRSRGPLVAVFGVYR